MSARPRSAARSATCSGRRCSIVLLKVARHLRRRPRRHDVHGLVRAQGHRRHAEPRRPQQGRPVRHPADARRRHEAVLQGGPPPRPGRPLRVPPGAVPRLRAGVPRVVGDPARRRLQRRQRRHRHVVRPRDAGAARRPADRHPARARAVVDRRLRHHARRLVERLEVPAARRGAGVGADDQLRGGARPQPRRRAARRPARCRPPASSPPRTRFADWNLVATGHRAVRHLHDRRHGRAQPAAVRPRRGRAGARRRVQHRVLEHSASPCSSSPSS